MSTRKGPGRSPGNPAHKGYQSTGIRLEAVQKHHATLPLPDPGQHLWTVMGMWHIVDPSNTTQQILDVENLLTIEGPGCYICEESYTPERAAQPCPGDPSGEQLR